ncbi:MAG: DUF4184 family protein [Deinococcota bacterium]
MPFTVSHVAAVIPLNRSPLVLSALIVGSMSPDVLYFVPGVPSLPLTHSVQGLLLFCLPVSFALLLIYHRLLKRPLLALLPPMIQHKVDVDSFQLRTVTQVARATSSILLGALTHIIWDSFTHISGTAVQVLPILQSPIGSFVGEPLYVYKLLQYASTVLGGLIVIVWIGYRVRLGEARASSPTAAYSPTRLVVMVTLSMLTGLIYGVVVFSQQGWQHAVVQTVVISMSTFAGVLVVFSIFWYILSNRIRDIKP